jgi:hypothetical protein
LEQFKASDDLNVKEINRKYLVARKAITDVTGGSVMSGKITCPICGKTEALIFTKYSNGHIRAACTEGCVNFIE